MDNLEDILADLSLAIKSIDSPPSPPVKNDKQPVGDFSRSQFDSSRDPTFSLPGFSSRIINLDTDNTAQLKLTNNPRSTYITKNYRTKTPNEKDEFPLPPAPPFAGYSESSYTDNANLPPPPPEAFLPPPPAIINEPVEQTRVKYTNTKQAQGGSSYESRPESMNPGSSNGGLSKRKDSVGTSKQDNEVASEDKTMDYIKEAESILDSLLPKLKGKTGIYDDDIYGVCAKCGEEVPKGDEACVALNKLYHSNCFTCHVCSVNLENQEFYNLNDEPYCKKDYANFLDKCTVCRKPIEGRILRATGKPYHPDCFICVVCSKNLVGKSFMTNEADEIHCVEDYYKKYAPECYFCKQPIIPEPGEDEIVRVVALDHSFHEQCFKCEDCGRALFSIGNTYYPLNDHVYCKECSGRRLEYLTRSTAV